MTIMVMPLGSGQVVVCFGMEDRDEIYGSCGCVRGRRVEKGVVRCPDTRHLLHLVIANLRHHIIIGRNGDESRLPNVCVFKGTRKCGLASDAAN
jgi:hypothetical protein